MATKNPSNTPAPEEDFWDLGDDSDLDLPEKTETSPSESIIPEVRKTPLESTPAGPIKVTEKSTAERIVPVEAKPPVSITDDPPPAPTRQQPKVERKPINLIEKVCIALLFLCLLGAGAWGISNYYSQAPERTLIQVTEDFPVEGEIFTIDSVETWWRNPIRKGPDADRGIKLDARLIPTATIHLSGSGNGTLRYSFRNSDGKIIGDSPALKVINGKFEDSRSPEITIHCTNGFTNGSNINPYINGDILPWTLEILEASTGVTPKQGTESLVKVLIDPIYKEAEKPEES